MASSARKHMTTPIPDPHRCPLHAAHSGAIRRLEERMKEREQHDDRQDSAISDLRTAHARVTAIAAFVIVLVNGLIMLGLRSLGG